MNFQEFTKLIHALEIDAILEEKVSLNAAASSKRISFGKYKGMLYSELPDSYLLWLLQNYSGSDREAIAEELKKRKL
jgi:hypothetical protein